MGDEYISREEVLNLIDTAFENGAFDGRYAYENLIDAVQNLIHPLETDCISREGALEILDDYAEDIESGNWEIAHSKARTSMCELPSVTPQPTTCDGCKHNGKFEDEVEYGYPSPCTVCKRRAKDNYER